MSKSPDVFLSYSNRDRAFADRLKLALASQGITIFEDAVSLHPGDDTRRHLLDALQQARAVVIVLSRNTRDSKWVHREVVAALEGAGATRPIIPVLLDGEARDNLVWPLVATRQAVGPTDAGLPDDDLVLRETRDAVFRALAPGVARERRSTTGEVGVRVGRTRAGRWWIKAALVFAAVLGLASYAVVSLGRRATETPAFAVSVSLLGGPTRSGEVRTGDKLLIRASASDLVAVYRDAALVLRCPEEARCAMVQRGWKAELDLVGPGTYRTVHAAGASHVALSGSLDADLLTLRMQGQQVDVLPLTVAP